jgi:hypothetical protein
MNERCNRTVNPDFCRSHAERSRFQIDPAQIDKGSTMIFIEIHGLWNGRPITDNASVTKLAENLEDQQMQITTLALQKISDRQPGSEPHEKAAEFARRMGFTRLDYHYQDNDTWMVVDILQDLPPATNNGSIH